MLRITAFSRLNSLPRIGIPDYRIGEYEVIIIIIHLFTVDIKFTKRYS